jgi:hypothetical protein
MRFQAKSFPRPVLGNADDVDAGFQAPFKVKATGRNVELSFRFQNGSKSLASRIQCGEAAYAVHLECGSTFFRNCFESSTDDFKIIIPRTELYGSVDGIAVVVAKKEIRNYTIRKSHADYGDLSFSIEPGDILAISKGFDFDVDISTDDLQKISSIMVIAVDKERKKGELSINWHGQKIKVLMPESDFERFKALSINTYARSLLGMVVLLPVLSEAVRLALNPDGEFEDLRWWRCIKRKIKQLEVDEKEEPYKIAQMILDNPVSRCLENCTKVFEISD